MLYILSLEVDSKLNFDELISKLCNKSSGQLNALCRIGHLLGLEERKILINSFIYANFNYCRLVWHFSSRKSINKIENLRKSINVSPKWLFFRLWNSLKKLTNALWKLNEIISIRNFQSFRRKLSNFYYGLFWKKWKFSFREVRLKNTNTK